SGTVPLANQDHGISVRAPGNTLIGNLISGNGHEGVSILAGAGGNRVQDNIVGLDASGTRPLGNGGIGVHIYNAAGRTLTGNVISANGTDGVAVQLPGATGNYVEDNIIGLDIHGNLTLGNGASPDPDDFGVRINDEAAHNIVRRNVVSGNIDGGIRIDN